VSRASLCSCFDSNLGLSSRRKKATLELVLTIRDSRLNIAVGGRIIIKNCENFVCLVLDLWGR
jgi:hypothetical protein